MFPESFNDFAPFYFLALMRPDMRVYIKRGAQREVVLATQNYGLSFRLVNDSHSVVVPDFFPLRDREAELEKFESRTACHGCLGLINHGDEVFVCVITERSRAAKPTPYRTVYNIHKVEFFGLRREFNEQDDSTHPLAALRKFFSIGGFLYSSDFDLTAPVQNSQEKPTNMFATPADESFMWNQFLTSSLNKMRTKLNSEDQLAIYENGFLTTLIRGFASTVAVQVDGIRGTLTVVSKQSWLRAGTRFNSRGIDDDGNVANFVESETILWLKNGQQFGFLQLRGSVPLFWEQDPQLLSAKINITRPMESTEPATRKHFDNLISRFGAVHIVDLLAGSSSGSSIHSHSSSNSINSHVGTATESDLSARYEAAAKKIQGLRYTHFDFHKEVAGVGYSAASKLVDQIQASMLEFGFYSSNPTNQSAETEQIGVFRVNCLDCLDRTNLVQQLISKDALDLFLDFNDMYGNKELWEAHANLWADNGDQLSQNYTGTGALKSSYTRSGKMGIAGALSDVSKSVSRLYINNFVDKTRQSAIDELLGRSEGQKPVKIFDPINDHVWEEMRQRTREYSSESQISIFAGTFNVNGKSFLGSAATERSVVGTGNGIGNAFGGGIGGAVGGGVGNTIGSGIGGGIGSVIGGGIGIAHSVAHVGHGVGHNLVRGKSNSAAAAIAKGEPAEAVAAAAAASAATHTDDITNWLFPPESFGKNSTSGSAQLPDIYIIGFQELVELTTSQILSVDPSRKEYWEQAVSECLNSMGENYVMLRSGQLVGTAIMLFVKRSQLNNITEVEGTSKKTALGGITGNKGGVAVGFKYSNTRFVVVNAHLAAGMNNLEDRHNDYKLLINGLRLNGNRRIKDADVVIWMGDFNYRVDLPSETIRKMIKQNRSQETINKLLTFDQLTKQMELGETFPFFQEGDIHFMPTYKYDAGTDTFDSSDKQRAPAWTDRVLVKGQNVRNRAYNSVPSIKFSDHRPVYALLDVMVSVVDEERADKLYTQLYDKRRVYLQSHGDTALIGNTLQNPSSDTQKWWAGGGLSTKVPISAPKDMVLNPEKLNPFSNEPDFVLKPSAVGNSASTSANGSASNSAINSAAPSIKGMRIATPPLNPTKSPSDTSSVGNAPPVPPPRGAVTRKQLSARGSELSLLDVPPTRSKGSSASSLMDSDSSDVPYKSLI